MNPPSNVGTAGDVGIAFFVIYIGVYILLMLPLFTAAYAQNHALSWLAFIPLANLWLMCDMADKSPVWILVTLLPLGGLIFSAVMWMAIAEAGGSEPSLGLLMMLPVIGLITVFYVVYGQQQKTTV